MTVGTTVTIDGNSTGLVDSLEKAKTAVADVKTEAVKLSKQFKDVADDADKAAGSFVQNLGGGAAIKAIGGIGVAMGGVKIAVDALLGSAESLFSTMGEDGARASAEISTKMAEFGSALVKVFTGSTDLETVQRRLNLVIDGAITVFNGFLTPLIALSDLYWKLVDDTDDLTDATIKLNAARSANQKLVEQQQQQDLATGDKFQAATIEALKALGHEETARKLQQQQQAINIRGIREEAKEMLARNAAAEHAVEIDELADKTMGNRTILQNALINEKEARVKKVYDDIMNERAEGMAFLSTEDRLQLVALKKHAEGLEQDTLAENKRTVAAVTNSHSRTAAVSDEESKKRREAEETERKRREEEDRRKREEAQASRDRLQAAADESAELLRLRNEQVQIVRENLKAEADAKKEARQLDFDAIVGQNAKMVAIALVNKKKASDIARAVVGNTVNAYGDAAMVKAGIEAADGNWAQAGQLTAAGFAAYLVAAALGSDQKGKASTPPTQRAAPVQNYSYSLRVDAAFADGEAVSRHFARMQDGARQRGLIGA
jgi:hypothetical protein